MPSYHLDATVGRPSGYYSYDAQGALLDRLQQPSFIIFVVVFLLTIICRPLPASYSLVRPRRPGELFWDFVVTIIPARLLYAAQNWLHAPAFPIPASTLAPQPRSHVEKSDILRRLLGMDGPGGIITSVANVGRRSLSSLPGITPIKQDTDRPPGLGNYDNSCFQNSILQGLSSLETFPAYLAWVSEREQSQDQRGATSVGSLRDLIWKLTDPDYNGKTLWTPKKLKSLDTWQQQDAQEYFSKILDEIDREVAKVVGAQHRSSVFEMIGIRDDTEDSQHSDDSGYQSLPVYSKSTSTVRVLRNPLEGLMAQRVVCVQCGHSEGLVMIPFNCLTLNLGLQQTEHELYEGLDSYTDLETIDGVECAKCTLLKLQRLLNIIISRSKEVGASEADFKEPISRLKAVELALEEDDFQDKTLREKCKSQSRVGSTKTKQVAVARPPQSLAIHLNRSVFDEHTGHMFKNLAAVRFPMTLDLGPWCLGSAAGPAGPSDDTYPSTVQPKDEECWIIDPKSSMVSGGLKRPRIRGPIYELRAVITHQGRHENGHYVCYRRHPGRPSKRDDSDSPRSLEGNGKAEQVDVESISDNVDGGDGETLDRQARWWRLSDETVWEVPEEIVLAQGGVFMLFYDCVDTNSVLVPRASSQVEWIDRMAPLDDQGVGGTETGGNAEGRSRHDPLERQGQSHEPTNRTNERVTPKASIPRLIGDDGFQGQVKSTQQQGTTIAWSSLTPSLAEGERVDPTIPLHRPNR
ncbi:cysteine proteinase [Durotheca rogersii]|uniref:cysteine proteinase n=1 Tax=Durotheca rogersii TaxID=419775 RepID=UPI00221E8ED0|nr:cysteine proteinase [Durotheca rogersii]KAI5862743.1 cysteine proteinase [Durotheca rogersii]